MSKITPFYLRTLSALHAGNGKDNGLVDLPIQRELVTGYPKIEASTLKGALRSRVENLSKEKEYDKIHLAFGYDDQSSYKGSTDFSGEGSANAYAQYFAGALTFTDARLLLFPIRSMWGVFAHATCLYVLRRLSEDLEQAGQGSFKKTLGSIKLEHDQCFLPDISPLEKDGKVVLEEYLFNKKPKEQGDNEGQAIAAALNTATGLDVSRLVILPDDAFGDFTQLFTERMTRNKIDDKTGIVADGGLFTEEYLPAESVLYSLLIAEAPRQPKEEQGKKHKALPSDFKTPQDVSNFLTQDCWIGADKKVLQIGGNTTVGKGIVELTFKH
ncbi:MAG: type III-B CRISPR module RAMP protein Cmr4 [Phaeodactylibacter sp.]|uniref:type III-B CRISPR module RAMP protein Cmr4 n=1 Tax=Phaeodactylibacter sp. TaxID=1940289 RepID=UPI0032EADEE7